MATAMDILAAAAAAADCHYTRFSQRAVLNGAGLAEGEGADGICFGLAVVWLEGKLKCQEDVVLDAYFPRSSPAFSRAHLFWCGQHSTMWETLAGLTAAGSEAGSNSEDFDCSPDLSELSKFCNWLNAALGRRYFIVRTPTHAMAACGSKLGDLEFFDPNAGIVSCRSPTALARCLSAYFNEDTIKQAYKKQPQGRVVLSVKKFKKA